MCNPIMTGVGMAAATAGGILKARQNNETLNSAQDASNRVLQADQARQKELEDQRAAILASSLRTTSAPNQTTNMNTARQQIQSQYDAAVPDTTSRDAPPSSKNAGAGQDAVDAEYARTLAGALTTYKAGNTAQARVRAYDANKLATGIALANNGTDINTNAGIARADNQQAQFEAQRRYTQKLQKLGRFGIGDALQAGGALASEAGSAGYGPDIGDFLPVASNPAMGGELSGYGSSY